MRVNTVRIGVVFFNRQFFIYQDGPCILGVSLDASRHTLLTKREIKIIMIHILSISCDIKLPCSLNYFEQCVSVSMNMLLLVNAMISFVGACPSY